MGERCCLMMKTRRCSLYVVPNVVRWIVSFFGVEKMSISVETAEQATGGRTIAGAILFSDRPNGEIFGKDAKVSAGGFMLWPTYRTKPPPRRPYTTGSSRQWIV